MFFQQENVVFNIFNKIPVSVRYPEKGYPNKEDFAYILYSEYGGLEQLESILDDVQGIWYNNKGGNIIIYTKQTEREAFVGGLVINFHIDDIFNDSNKINIIKLTCKQLGMTQKELAAHINVHEETVSKWSRGIIDTPKWAIKIFELLKIEKKFNALKQTFTDELNK